MRQMIYRYLVRRAVAQYRASGDLDRILEDGRYALERPDFGEDWFNVYLREDHARGRERFSTIWPDEARLWMVQRHRDVTGSPPRTFLEPDVPGGR